MLAGGSICPIGESEGRLRILVETTYLGGIDRICQTVDYQKISFPNILLSSTSSCFTTSGSSLNATLVFVRFRFAGSVGGARAMAGSGPGASASASGCFKS